jgi:hypothetical protein
MLQWTHCQALYAYGGGGLKFHGFPLPKAHSGSVYSLAAGGGIHYDLGYTTLDPSWCIHRGSASPG